MRRYLLAALWPAGMTAIAAATVMAARRSRAAPALVAVDAIVPVDPPPGPAGTTPPGAAVTAEQDSTRLAEVAAAPVTQAGWARDLARLGAASCAAGALSYGVMTLLGPPVVNHGPAIDEPIFRWTSSNQLDWWAAVMERFNKVGNTWTVWGASGAAAACLGVTWPQRKWLPPAALGAAVVVDHYVTLALRHKFGRPGPPTSPLGSYPSGGCDRVVLFYGLIAHMLWRESGASYQGKVWGIGAVTALSFNVAYCREYLSRHWSTDIAFGLFYGLILLGPFIAAIRLIAGPAGLPAGQDRAAVTTLMAA